MNGLNQWYWGHTNVDEYSLVFFYHIDPSLKITPSAYLARDGIPIVSGCSIIQVTPQGPGASVPLKGGTDVESWAIRIEDTVYGSFGFTVQNIILSTMDSNIYTRWVGRTTGGPVGGTNSTGAAITEWMNNPGLVP